jgi:hypothetical protein
MPGSSALGPAFEHVEPSDADSVQPSGGRASARATPLKERNVTATAAKGMIREAIDFMDSFLRWAKAQDASQDVRQQLSIEKA